MIFRRYAELGSVRSSRRNSTGWVSSASAAQGAGGRPGGRQPILARRALYLMLQNPHLPRRDRAPGQGLSRPARGHRRCRALATRPGQAGRQPTGPSAWRDCGGAEPACRADRGWRRQRMTPTHAVKKGRRYRYYVSTALITEARSLHGQGLRVPAGDVEALVLDRIRAFFASEQDVGETLSRFGLDAATLRSSLKKAAELTHGWAALPSIKIRELVRSIVERVS